jgi:hypothetical protein
LRKQRAATIVLFANALESPKNLCDITNLYKYILRRVTGKEVNLRMGRIISLSGITLFAATLTLAGCGKKEEPPPPPPPAPAPAEPAPAPAPAPETAPPAGDSAKDPGMEKKEEGKTN